MNNVFYFEAINGGRIISRCVKNTSIRAIGVKFKCSFQFKIEFHPRASSAAMFFEWNRCSYHAQQLSWYLYTTCFPDIPEGDDNSKVAGITVLRWQKKKKKKDDITVIFFFLFFFGK